jgi:hypothetical protein
VSHGIITYSSLALRSSAIAYSPSYSAIKTNLAILALSKKTLKLKFTQSHPIGIIVIWIWQRLSCVSLQAFQNLGFFVPINISWCKPFDLR